MIGRCHQLSSEIRWTREDGTDVPLPDFDDPDLDYRQWKADHVPGTETGPNVRVAGRIMHAGQGKLKFLTLRDWTGDIQIFIGKKQVGEDDFEVAEVRLGRLVGIEGRLGRTNTGELTVFAESLFFHGKTLEPPPDKHAGLTNPDLRQRMRYVDLAYNDGVLQTFLGPHQDRPIDPPDARRRRLL